MRFNKIFEKIKNQKKVRSIENSGEYISDLKEEFEEKFLELKQLIEVSKIEPGQARLDEIYYLIYGLDFIFDKIKLDLKDTKEGKEYFDIELQLKEKPDSLVEVERDILLDGSEFSDFRQLEKRLKEIKKEAQRKFMPIDKTVEA